MKKLVPRPLPIDPLLPEAAADLARIVAIAADAGYSISETDAATIWRRHCADTWCITWLTPDSDEEIRTALDQQGQLREDGESTPADAAEAVAAMREFMQAAPDQPEADLRALIEEGRAGDAEVEQCSAQGPAGRGSEVEPLPPPEGFASWLDYAVATMDTRAVETAGLLEDEGRAPTRQAMRAAVAAELAEMRQAARELALIDNAPLIAAERARLARERERLEDQELNKLADARVGQPSTKVRLEDL